MTSLLHEIYEPKRIQLLIESLGIKELLLEITIPELKKQWVDSHRVTEKQFADVEEALGELGAAYVAWFLARSITDKLIDFDDLDIWANRLKVFKNNNKVMTIKDLGQVKTADDLETVTKDVGDSRLKNYAKAERAFQGASRAGKSVGNKKIDPYYMGECPTSKGTFRVYKIPANRPELYWLARKLGAGTSWCTHSSSGYYNHYTEDGPLYVLIGKAGEKYQIHIESNQFKDKNDAEVRYAEKWVEEVYLWLQEKDGIKLSRAITQIIEKRKAFLDRGKTLEAVAEGFIQKASTQIGEYTLIQWDKLSVEERSEFESDEGILRDACAQVLGITNYTDFSWCWSDAAVCYKNGDNSKILVASHLNVTQTYGAVNLIRSYGRENVYSVIQKEPEMFNILLQLYRHEDIRREIRRQFAGVLNGTLRLEDFPEEQLEGTKFRVRILNSRTEGDLKGIYETLTGKPDPGYRLRKIIVVSLSDDAYLCHAFVPNWYKLRAESVSTFTDMVGIIKYAWYKHNTGAAIWDRPFEFWYSFWKPFLNFIQGEEGLQMPLDNFEDIKSIGKYGHKGELLASRYSLQGLSTDIATVFRVPSNRLDLPGTLGFAGVDHEGLLIKYDGDEDTSLKAVYIENLVGEGTFSVYLRRYEISPNAKYYSPRWTGCGYERDFNSRRYSKWVPSGLRPVIKKAIAYLTNNTDKDITKRVYDDIYLKTPEQQARELARREKAAEREARKAEREARRAERAAQPRPERQPRVRQARQNIEPQQEPAQNADRGEQRGRAMTIRWSTGRRDILISGIEITFEEALEKLQRGSRSVVENAGILRDRKEQEEKVDGTTIRAFEDESNGKVYVYFLRNGHTIVHYATGGRIIDVEHTINTNLNESQFKVIFRERKVSPNSLLSFLIGA